MKEWLGIGLLLSLLLVPGCGQEQEVIADPVAKTPVTVYQVGAVNRGEQLIASAKAEPIRQSRLSFQVGGKIIDLAQEWSMVQQGEAIASLDKDDYALQLANAKAQYELARLQQELVEKGLRDAEKKQLKKRLEAAKASLEKAQRDYEDGQQLLEAGALSVSNFKDLETNYFLVKNGFEQAQLALSMAEEGARPEEKEQAQQELQRSAIAVEAAKRDLEKTELIAHYQGILSLKLADKGEIVGPGTPVFQLTQLNPIYMRMFANSTSFIALQEGTAVDVFLPDLSASTEGRIAKKNSVADPLTGTFAVDILVDNAEGFIKPGMTGEISYELPTENSLWIPIASLIRRGENLPYVFVLDSQQNRVSRRDVTVGTLSGDWIEAAAGIREGETIVLRGASQLTDGQEVVVRQEESGVGE